MDELEDELVEQMSDDDVPENVHNRLLGAISNLYKQKRVKAPVRKETSLQLSEFHLTGVRPEDKKSGKIELSELTRVLEKRAGHTKINEQLKSAKRKTRKLPKPLEKPQAEKLERSVAYENLKKDLNKWDSIVYQQRVAEQINFPLKEPKVVIHKDSNDFLTTFKTPTELELQLAESLNSSESLKKEKEEEELENIKLSLEEIKERRSIMARLRAQLSYKEAKAARLNKIKSKKFHRIQRKDKIKMQLKEFEELQKSDPEAALKKLEQLEKVRAQERASLRHRSTGQWARNLAVRAKYNKEARIALSEQLTKSRELTQKLQTHQSSSEEESVSENDEGKEPLNDGDDNTWLSKEHKSEVQDFYEKYKKFEKQKIKETAKNNNFNSSSENHDVVNKNKTSDGKAMNGWGIENREENLIINNCSTRRTNEKESEIIENCLNLKPHKGDSKTCNKNLKTSHSRKINKESISNCMYIKKPRVEIEFSVLRKSPMKVVSDGTVISEKDILRNCKPLKRKLPVKTGAWSVTSVKKNFALKDNRKLQNKTNTKSKNVFPNSSNIKTDSYENKADLDDMFFEVEERLKDTVKEGVKKLKKVIETETFDNKSNDLNSDHENGDDNNSFLKMKKKTIQAEIDEELLETPSNNPNEEVETLFQKVLKSPFPALDDKGITNNIKSGNIEPNNFLCVKSKRLNSELPSSFANAEDYLDDVGPDSKTDEKSMTISEAFACDDVDEEFKQDKEEEIKKSQVEDVNLVLPGWGSWGGPNVNVPKHKKRRFIIKFPKKVPRKDENKGDVVINEDKDEKIKPLTVTELPFPFTSVKEYEASIRAPIGGTWLPQSAHRKLIAPTVTTKLGTVIEPMTKDQIIKKKGEWK